MKKKEPEQKTLAYKILRYRIPKKELVREVLSSIAKEKTSFSSLAEMAKEVNARLKRLNRSYVVSTSRCRELSRDFFDVNATPGSRRSLKVVCPACGGSLGVIRNKTINGSEVTLSYMCKNCGYSSKEYLRVPARYRFSPKNNI